MNNLYMHNFMLLCKDFCISENKINPKVGIKNSMKDHLKESMPESKASDLKTEILAKRRSSKGLVPESIQISAQFNRSKLKEEIGQKP